MRSNMHPHLRKSDDLDIPTRDRRSVNTLTIVYISKVNYLTVIAPHCFNMFTKQACRQVKYVKLKHWDREPVLLCSTFPIKLTFPPKGGSKYDILVQIVVKAILLKEFQGVRLGGNQGKIFQAPKWVIWLKPALSRFLIHKLLLSLQSLPYFWI